MSIKYQECFTEWFMACYVRNRVSYNVSTYSWAQHSQPQDRPSRTRTCDNHELIILFWTRHLHQSELPLYSLFKKNSNWPSRRPGARPYVNWCIKPGRRQRTANSRSMLELIVHVSVPLPPQGLTTVNHTDKTRIRSGLVTDHLCELIQYVTCKASFVGQEKLAKPDEGIPSCCQEHWGIHSGRPPLHSVKERSRHYIYDICGRFDHCTSCGKQCSIVNFFFDIFQQNLFPKLLCVLRTQKEHQYCLPTHIKCSRPIKTYIRI